MTASLPSGNGNANCFWEDPAKAIAPTKVNAQQNGTGKTLAKSQTVSNMQSVANNPKANQNPPKSTAIMKTNSSGNVTAIVNSTANNNNNNKKAKAAGSASKKGKFCDNSQILFANGYRVIKRHESLVCFSDHGDDEFGAWCAKALTAHNDVIDGKFA